MMRELREANMIATGEQKSVPLGRLSVQDIYEATLLAGYHWRSQEPMNALNVKMYTDKTFKKVSPATFVLRKG